MKSLENKQYELVQVLVQNEFDIKQHGSRAIYQFLSKADKDTPDEFINQTVVYLLDSGSLPSYKGPLLDAACRFNIPTVIRHLLKYNSVSESCLIYAIERDCNIDVIDILLEHNCCVTADIIIKAIQLNSKENVEHLLARGNINVNTIVRGKTFLMYACQYSTIGMVQLLVDLGANVSVKDTEGQTLLHYAARSMLNAAVTLFLLMQKGWNIDLDAKTIDGYTALDLCILPDIAEYLTSFNGHSLDVLRSFRDDTFSLASDKFTIESDEDEIVLVAQLLNEIIQKIEQMNDEQFSFATLLA
ncbi:unnamed protein product [Didymodactylos carnosus]|uniref:Ankyrin repeat-containing protein n=1 Tax=Didymodactylos carnosus TaxID=1234261 RepID=A0A8S2SNH0_9BILA|nr:unnamed protein product [Didymodactylos carnosus]CAF4234112.1 unnamed protein product [Didymodactylos carnosus]